MYLQGKNVFSQEYTQEQRKYEGDQQNYLDKPTTERKPEVQREHDALMSELAVLSKMFSELAQKLSPVRAEQPERATAAICGVGPVTPVTEIGQRIRAANAEVAGLRRRVETLLSEVEV